MFTLFQTIFIQKAAKAINLVNKFSEITQNTTEDMLENNLELRQIHSIYYFIHRYICIYYVKE